MKKILTFLILVFFGGGVFCQGLTVTENAYVAVKGGGIIKVVDGKLLVKASATGMGSVLEDANANNNITVSGTGAQTTVQTYIVADKYHYVSSPLTNATANTFYEMWLKPYVESTNAWGQYIYITTTPLPAGTGYAAYSYSTGTPAPGTKSVNYISNATNALNNGSISPAVTFNGSGNNLVGNPYPSAIDWNAVTGWTRTNIGYTIYIWNPVNNQYGIYIKDAPSGTNGASNIILPGQGFFVVASGSPTFSLNNNVRVQAGTGKTILKNSNSFFKIGVEEVSQDISDELLVSFSPNGDVEFNAYDAEKWFSTTPEVPSLYTLKTDHKLAGNTYRDFDVNLVIPMGFKKGTAGSDFRLFIAKPEGISGLEQVFVKDKMTGIITDLVATDEYVFTSFEGDDPMRFEIMFKSSLGIEDQVKSTMQVYFSNQQILLRNLNENPVTGTMTIFNLAGQALQSSRFDVISGTTSFDTNLAFGAYLVEVITNEGRFTQKIIVN